MESHESSDFVPYGDFQESIMFCPECEHQNPVGNRFCGMCGAQLRPAPGPESYGAVPAIPGPEEAASPEATGPMVPFPAQFGGGEPADPHDAQDPEGYGEYTDALLADLTPVSEAELAEEQDSLSQAWTEEPLYAEQVTTELAESDAEEFASEPQHAQPSPIVISGPSFLGLGETSASDGRSYLLDDDDEDGDSTRRHGWLIAVAAVVILGAIAIPLTLNWNGARDWVATRGTLLAERVRNLRAEVAGRAEQGTSQGEQNDSEATLGVETPSQSGQSGAEETQAMAAQENQAQAGLTPEPEMVFNPAEGGFVPQGQSETPSQPEEDAVPAAPTATQSDSSGVQNRSAQEQQPEQPPAGVQRAANTAPANGSSSPSSSSSSRSGKAAGESESESEENLVAAGERYLYGQGVPRDCNQALVYFRAGAQRQNPRALSRMGALYATGTCVPMDRVVAYNWFSRALARDSRNPSLEDNLNILWREMSAGERRQVLEPRR